MDASQVSDRAVIQAYQSQAHAEGGWRFLKDPLGFVSSLFVKKPSRIHGGLTVLTFAFRVYAVAQRRLRQP
jgi:transposase